MISAFGGARSDLVREMPIRENEIVQVRKVGLIKPVERTVGALANTLLRVCRLPSGRRAVYGCGVVLKEGLRPFSVRVVLVCFGVAASVQTKSLVFSHARRS